MNKPRVEIFGTKIDPLTMRESLDAVAGIIEWERRSFLG